VLLVIELGLNYHMCDLHSTFEKDRTKTTVAVVDDRYCGQTDGQTDREIYIQVILYLSNAKHYIGQAISL